MNLIGAGPQFGRSKLAVVIMSDMVVVFAAGLVWFFLYLWADAYHDSHGERALANKLWPRLIAAGLAWVGVLAIITIVLRVLFFLPGNKFEGRVSLFVLPMIR